MSNLVNIDAETGANIIGDDSSATLELQSSGGGYGLKTRGLVNVSTASIDVANIASLTASTTRPVSAANATLASFNLTGSSVASGALFALKNLSAFVSTSTIKANTAVAADCGAIRVIKPDGTFGWIPVYPDSAVTGIAV